MKLLRRPGLPESFRQTWSPQEAPKTRERRHEADRVGFRPQHPNDQVRRIPVRRPVVDRFSETDEGRRGPQVAVMPSVRQRDAVVDIGWTKAFAAQQGCQHAVGGRSRFFGDMFARSLSASRFRSTDASMRMSGGARISPTVHAVGSGKAPSRAKL